MFTSLICFMQVADLASTSEAVEEVLHQMSKDHAAAWEV